MGEERYSKILNTLGIGYDYISSALDRTRETRNIITKPIMNLINGSIYSIYLPLFAEGWWLRRRSLASY